MEYFIPLVMREVHLQEETNAILHHTDTYELVHLEPPTLVLRRGQPFLLVLCFNRPFVQSTDSVRLTFSFGRKPNMMKRTRGIITITGKNKNVETDLYAWGAHIIASDAKNLSVEVRSPVDCPVGVWQLDIETSILRGNQLSNTYRLAKDIYLLFNPWLKDDMVYMENQKLLDEYVSNDTGKIWYGQGKNGRGREWVFGQFDACILPACQFLLEKSGLKEHLWGDPIRMSRAISKIVNWNDDDGVLIGRWDDKYSDGIAPSAWTGSVPILEQYLRTQSAVLYGQCWVFAGVTTTVCRALGLPSRVITNFESAHDSDGSLTIDRYYDAVIDGFHSEESIWNFHVWNEVWMARPDLPTGYGGWQAIDATPQERSDGMYQCGPTSVEAIKQGAVGYNYDVPFMLATVNADIRHFVKDSATVSGWRYIDSNKRQVGLMILTKAPFIFDPNGDRDREDITECYKSKEGTRGERFALIRAARSIGGERRFNTISNSTAEDVKFKLIDLERVKLGESFALAVEVKNTSNHLRTIQANLSVRSVYYNGVNGKLVREVASDLVVRPGEREVLRVVIKVNEYLDKLVEYCMMKLFAHAKVKETNQIWADEDDFQVLKPTITVEIKDRLVVGKPAPIILSFTNPLPNILTECKLHYAGPGLKKNGMIILNGVGAHGAVRVEYKIVPQKAGKQQIVVTFTSKELIDVTGSATVEVFV